MNVTENVTLWYEEGSEVPLSNQVPLVIQTPRSTFQPLNITYDPLKHSIW